MRNILYAAEEAIRFGEELGVSEIEVFVTSVDRKNIDLTSGIETLYTSNTAGLGVRVLIGKRVGFHATSSLVIKDVRRSVETAYSIAKLAKPDPEWFSLPVKIGKARVERTFDKEVAELEPRKLVEAAVQMIDVVNDCGEKASITRGEVSAETVEIAIVNSHNCNLHRKESFASANVTVKVEEAGLKGMSSESQQVRRWSGLNCSSIAQQAAERASKVIYAESIGSGKMPVVWRNKLFASILRIMFRRTLSADSVQKQRSPWIGKVGKPVASENFNLVDEGLLRAGLGTREFDDDGIPQRRVILIDHGILQGFLYDNYTANKERRESTGNASRDYRSFPSPLPNNLVLQPGRENEQGLLKDVKRGLYIVETIGMWLSNPISGDLSATVTNAFLIENGELTKPIKGVIVSGNFFNILLHKIDLTANDVDNLGSTYSPSVRISEMTITGE